MPRRATIILDLIAAYAAGEDRHPRVVMMEMAHRCEFRLTDASAQVLAQTWTFEVETDMDQLPSFPPWIHARRHR